MLYNGDCNRKDPIVSDSCLGKEFVHRFATQHAEMKGMRLLTPR